MIHHITLGLAILAAAAAAAARYLVRGKHRVERLDLYGTLED